MLDIYLYYAYNLNKWVKYYPKETKGETKMKKVMSAIVTAFAVLTLCICLAACSENSTNSKETVTGTYTFYSCTFEGKTIKVGETFNWGKLLPEFYVVILKEDNSATISSWLEPGDTDYCNWEAKDEENGKYVFKTEDADSKEVEFTIKDGAIIFDTEVGLITLKKDLTELG